jgi:hypothetical protein
VAHDWPPFQDELQRFWRGDGWKPVPQTRPVRRPKASVGLPQSVAEHAVESLLRIAEGTSVHPDLVARSLADVLAAALEQAKAEDAR